MLLPLLFIEIPELLSGRPPDGLYASEVWPGPFEPSDCGEFTVTNDQEFD